MTFTVFRQGSELAGGRYVLERRLGSGGMATVWLASDERLRRPVAIKIPTDALLADDAFARRFDREAQTAAGLSHPNLVAVYDYGNEGDRPYLVSEYIDGPSLEKLRQSGDAPPVDLVAEALLAALGHIHAAGIVHRDVKPGNVLVESWDRILLTDFGIAQSTEETRLTQTHHVVGTRDFLAPEVMRGERATPASDLFACGVVLKDLLEPGDAPALGELIDRLTELDPADRPASAEDARALLDADDAEEPAPSRMPAPPVPVAARRPPESVLADEPPAEPPTDERPLAREEPPERDSGDRPSRLALGLMAAAAALIVAAAVALSVGGGGDGDETTTGAKQAATDKPENDRTVTQETTVTETSEAPPAETTTVPTESGSSDDGVALNNEGYALLQSGDVEAALPKLEQAVAAFPEDSTDINYAYALFNYAQALRMSGDPAAAIPLLQKRLAISDFKVDEVQAELATAEAEASGKKPKKIKDED